jgi:hypothetical protein
MRTVPDKVVHILMIGWGVIVIDGFDATASTAGEAASFWGVLTGADGMRASQSAS